MKAYDADARQVAGQTRRGELRVLHEVNAGLDSERARLKNVHVLCDERALLRARGAREREREGQREGGAC